ncbi:MAG: hypothetical protein ABL858_02260 [Candidatus Nitrotoga sp.]
MRYKHPPTYIGIVLTTLILLSCSPGENPSDVFPNAAPVIKPTSGPDSFLLFPNPQKQDDGTLQTNTTAYATAYYEAIDPTNAKDTLAKWKIANGFGSGGTEVNVVFGDVKDLGYGRRMTARDMGGGSYAFMVENYAVAPAANYGYSSFNLDAAVARDPRWHVGTNAIEFSPATCITGDITGCDPSVKFAKFYTFHPTTGARLLEANLDGRGNKAMPGICISCHGGRAYPLTPLDGSGKPLFPVIGFTASKKRGDVEAHLQPFDVGSFGFSTVPGYTRADQEFKLKTINQMVLCTYPKESTETAGVDTCRRNVVFGEWSGTPAATIIKNAYGGNALEGETFSDTFVPMGWSETPEQTALYNDVVVPACRTCHILRGTRTMPDLNFNSYAAFSGYADQIKGHVIDRGNMPLAKIVYERLWSGSGIETLASFLETNGQTARDTSGAVLKPGRPVAVPGPDRITTSPATLSAAGSLYADSYSWSIFSGSNGSLINPTSATPTLNGQSGTTYVLQLVASKGTTQSVPVQVSVTIASAGSPLLPIAPTDIRFANIKAVLQGPQGCTSCHTPTNGGPPIFYTNIDRNGDGVTDTTDDEWFYTELRGRINFTDITSSALLRKPSGHHHGGGLRTGFDSTTAPGDAARENYDLFLNWLLNGAPRI